MKKLRGRFERFCFRNRNKGIPNLMLYISIGTAIVYLISRISQNDVLYDLLCFNRDAILHGQVWRLVTYPLTLIQDNILFQFICLLCYYSLGRAMENQWGICKFNLFYLTGVVLMDIYSMIFGGTATVYYLNMSLFLSYATMYPQASFLLFFIIPIKAWVFALFDLVIILIGLFSPPYGPWNFFPVIALANYFLFFGKDVLNLIPVSWTVNFRRLVGRFRGGKKKAKVIPFPDAGSYEASVQSVKAPYTHRCTVCGRTDVTNPELEFRYCSRCKGYYCYCQDHINNHAHIQ